MLIIVDKKIPEEAKKSLVSTAFSPQGLLVELETNGLVYPAISGHPDIFFCLTPQTLIISPNLPPHYFHLLNHHKISYIKGKCPVGKVDPEIENTTKSTHRKKQKRVENKVMTCYNAAVNDQYLVHRLEYTDPVILENCHHLKKIAVKQGYTRCNLLLLKKNHFITSDMGIHITLKNAGLEGLYIAPQGIVLDGFPNGFIGGAMGLFMNNIYITGSLKYLPDSEKIAGFLRSLDYRIIEMHDGPLFDGGGILFVTE